MRAALTTLGDVSQRPLVAAQVAVDAVAPEVVLETPQLVEEGQVLLRVLQSEGTDVNGDVRCDV